MGKSRKKYYAVARGRKTGIFNEWYGEDGAENQIRSFPNARYKGFVSLREAEEWFLQQSNTQSTGKPASKRSKISAKPVPPNTDILKEAGQMIIYTDGGCINNPGPGGYGVVKLKGKQRKELSGGFKFTTNNRMELMACIAGLRGLKSGCSVVIYSDSKYVVDGITKGWAKKWRANNWMRNKIDPAQNADLWAQLLDLCEKHSATFVWVKGHAGNPENERCDQLATQAASRKDLPLDRVYEKL
jgi:ribonuclease HI